jgi:NAD+ synthase (glutamine-hydrolysing)
MVPLYYVNCVGAQNTGKNIVTFDGGTTVYNGRGEIYNYISQPYREQFIIVDSENVKGASIKRDVENKIEEKYLAIKQGLLHMKDVFGTEKDPEWVVGASGGIDSSLVVALLVDTFGKNNVLIVNMPSKYNSQKTIGAFEYLAKTLELKSFVSPITGTYIELYNMLEESGVALASPLNEENEQAKIRNLILSSIAARENAIYTCNGNKLEIALGYFTLDGDGRGSIAPIADLTKVEIYEMSKFLNKEIFKKEVIPTTLFPDEMFRFSEEKIQPSAELKEKQVDPMKWGYHDALLEALMNYQIHPVEEIMEWYLNGTLAKNLGITYELLERWDITTPKTFIDDIKWFYNSMRKNVFKRVQSPPIIITSKTAFGNDRREAQLPPLYRKKMAELEEKILNMKKYVEK